MNPIDPKIASINTVANLIQLTMEVLRKIDPEYIEIPPTVQMAEHIQALVANKTGGYHA